MCVYVCMYLYICMCVYVYMYIHMYMCLCHKRHIYSNIHTHTHSRRDTFWEVYGSLGPVLRMLGCTHLDIQSPLLTRFWVILGPLTITKTIVWGAGSICSWHCQVDTQQNWATCHPWQMQMPACIQLHHLRKFPLGDPLNLEHSGVLAQKRNL